MKQLLNAIGVFFALVSNAGSAQWYTAQDGRQYLIEAEAKYNYFEAWSECISKNSILSYFERGTRQYVQIDSLLEELKDKTAMDFWIAGRATDAEAFLAICQQHSC